jgi:hypothetical protein
VTAGVAPNEDASHLPEAHATVQPLGCTLRGYSAAKALPEAQLRRFGVREVSRHGLPALRIPYLNGTDQECAVRFRVALAKSGSSDDRFSWKSGSKPFLYGLWRLRHEASVIVVEGESDCHTLWFYDINAVGLPGSGMWREARDAAALADFELIYVLVEPDAGGEATIRWVEKTHLREKIRLVRLPGFKDPSAMHVDDPNQFKARWETALAASVTWRAEEAKRSAQAREKAFAACADLARERDTLTSFVRDLRRAGVVGVEREAKLLFIAITSRVLERPISVAIKGPSSSGKSFLVAKVLSFFAQRAYGLNRDDHPSRLTSGKRDSRAFAHTHG